MLKIGDTVPIDYPRGITSGPDIAPVWFALVVPPQKERAVCQYLDRHGVYAFFPSEEKRWRRKGKVFKRDIPIVSRHVYAQFKQAPQWDVMKEQRRLITGVYAIGDRPVEIPRDIIRRLQGLTVGARRLEEARAELARVRTGDRATISAGPLAGFLVDVERVSGGMAWFAFLTGGKGRAAVATLEREVPKGEAVLGLIDDETAPSVAFKRA